MLEMQGVGAFSGSPGMRAYILLFLLAFAAFLYWKSAEGLGSHQYCPPCICDCPFILAQGSGNRSADCTKIDSAMSKELDKNSVDLLTEELKLQAEIADDVQKKAHSVLNDAKKLSFQYQKEAAKCNTGLETCEEATERAAEALLTEQKITSLWKLRAETLGWKAEDSTNAPQAADEKRM